MIRRPLVAAAAVLTIAGVTGCGIGQGNETQREHEVEQAAKVSVGDIQFNDIYITPINGQLNPPPDVSLAPSDVPIVTPSSSPTPTPTPSPGAAQAYLVATVTNSSGTQADRVTGARIVGPSGASGTVSLAPPNAPLTVPPNGQLHFNDPAATSTGPFLVISDVTTPLRIGTSVQVAFTVAGEGQLPPVAVPIISSFAGAPPSSPPVPTSTASGSPAGGSSAAASASTQSSNVNAASSGPGS